MLFHLFVFSSHMNCSIHSYSGGKLTIRMIHVHIVYSLIPRYSKNRRECLVHTAHACVKNSVILSVKFIMTRKLSLQIVTWRNIR